MTIDDMICTLTPMRSWPLTERECKAIIAALRAAAEFVEEREEATENIWYCTGETGRKLLRALGIPYEEKS